MEYSDESSSSAHPDDEEDIEPNSDHDINSEQFHTPTHVQEEESKSQTNQIDHSALSDLFSEIFTKFKLSIKDMVRTRKQMFGIKISESSDTES